MIVYLDLCAVRQLLLYWNWSSFFFYVHKIVESCLTGVILGSKVPQLLNNLDRTLSVIFITTVKCSVS